MMNEGKELGMIDPEATIRRSERTAFKDLSEDKGAVLLHMDSAAYHSMNQIGTEIWKILEHERTFEELVSELRTRIGDSTPPDLNEDVGRFLEALRERDLVEID